MGTPAPLAETPYSSLSDEQLIELLHASDEERYRSATQEEQELFKKEPERFIKSAVKEVLHELWNRHYPLLERKVRSKLWRLCPLQYGDPDSFVRETLNEAYLAFIRRIKSRDAKGQKYTNFSGYVYTLFLNVGRDKARRIIGRSPDDQDEEEKGATLPEYGAAPPTKSAAQGKKPDPPPRPTPVPLDAASDVSLDETPEQKLSREDLKRIIIEVINKHGIDNPISTQTVLLQSQEDNWTKVTNAVMPPEVFKKSLRRRIDDVKKLYEKDRLELGKDLSERGIMSEHVFHFREAGSGTATQSEDE
ncbi:MAG: hypothetical protein WAQ52_03645 [Terriglobales bacterium]